MYKKYNIQFSMKTFALIIEILERTGASVKCQKKHILFFLFSTLWTHIRSLYKITFLTVALLLS